MKRFNFSTFASLIALATSITIFYLKPLTWPQGLSLFFNLEGTVLLASSISFSIVPIGNTLIEKIKWVFIEFPKYSSPPSFSVLKFYGGLLFIFFGSVIGVISSKECGR